MTLLRILGDDDLSLVIRIDIHQMKILQNYSHASTLIFLLHHLTAFKYYSGFMESMRNNIKTQTRGQ